MLLHCNVITRIHIVSKVLSRDLPDTKLKFLVPLSIGWRVSGQQGGRLADTHVYVYICLIASMPTYLPYRTYHIYIYIYIYSIVYTMICMDIKKCWHVSDQHVSGRQVNMYTLIYINGYLPSLRPADRAYHV